METPTEVIAAVETEVKKVAQEVKAEAVKVEEVTKEEVEKIRIDVSTDEKLIGTKLENAFLKTQMELQRLSTQSQGITKQYTDWVEGLVNKYAIDKAVYVFDSVEMAFVKKAQQVPQPPQK